VVAFPVEELEDGLRWLFTEVYNAASFGHRQRHYMEIAKDLM